MISLIYGILLLCFLPTLILGTIIFINQNKAKYYLPLSGMILFSALWMFSIAIVYLSRNPIIGEIFLRTCFIAASMILACFARFIYIFPGESISKYNNINFALIYFSQLLIIPLILLGYIVTLANPVNTVINYLSLYLIYKAIIIGLFIYSMFLLIKKRLNAKGKTKIQLLYLSYLFGSTTMACILSNVLLAKMQFFNIRANTLGPYFMMIMISGLFYIITRHSFLKISLLIRKSLIYSVILTLVTVLYALIFFYAQNIVNNSLMQYALITLLILFYGKIYRLTAYLLDKSIFKSDSDYNSRLQDISKNILKINTYTELYNYIIKNIYDNFHPKYFKILVKQADHYSLYKNNTVKKIKAHHNSYINSIFSKYSNISVNRVADRYVFGISAEGLNYGLLFLGTRSNYISYTKEDIEFIITLANNATLALEKIESIEKAETRSRQLIKSQGLSNLGRLSACIAHEIKNPLTGLTLGLENVREYSDNPEIVRTLSDSLFQLSTDLNHHLVNMLSVAKGHDYRLQNLLFSEVFGNIIFLINKKARDNKVVVKTNFPSALMLTADPEKIQQILLNLCMNSIEAMENGGILIIGAYETSDKTVIYVKDTGSGIQEIIIDNMFDAFTTTKESGFGLGLSITKDLVNLHNGELIVNNKTKTGAEFIVMLPKIKQEVSINA